MAEDNKNNTIPDDENYTPLAEDSSAPSVNRPQSPPPPENNLMDNDEMGDRLERLGGEPAPVITPEEFARLQKAGQVHIDSRGRVRTASRSGPNAGVSLRKRRAWYG